MKKRFFSVYDIIFIIAAAAIFIFAVMLPPVRSIADQGDFERVMRPCGLDFPAGYTFFDYAVRFYEMNFTSADLWLFVPRLLFLVPSTPFIFPVTLAKLICMPFGAFDMRVTAVIMFLLYTAICFFILRRVKIQNPVLRLLFTAAFIFIFYNGVNLTFFNSLYGQSVMLGSFAALILAGIHLFDDINNASVRKIIFFSLSSCLMLSSKLQCAVFLPFLCGTVIFASVKSRYIRAGIICAALILWHGAGGYIINGGQLNIDTQYNSVFYGILKDSNDPQADLRALGIDENMYTDAGKHAYLDPSEYTFPPRTDITYEKFHSKISNGKLIGFYITHPVRFLNAMETTAQNAFSNKITLGTFEEKYGFEKGKSSYRLEMWENIRSSLPKTLWFIVPVYCLFLAFAVILFKKKHKYALPILCMIFMGAVQFPMPYIGNGAADISKQLFMFNTVFDFFTVTLIYCILLTADKKIKFFTKNS